MPILCDTSVILMLIRVAPDMFLDSDYECCTIRRVRDELFRTQKFKTKYAWRGDYKDMKSLEIFDTQDHMTEIAAEMGNVTLIPKDSILIVVRSGILQRTVPVAITRVRVTINQDMRAFTIKDARLSPDFLLHYLNARQDALLRLVKYSTTVQSINKEAASGFSVVIPKMLWSEV